MGKTIRQKLEVSNNIRYFLVGLIRKLIEENYSDEAIGTTVAEVLSAMEYEDDTDKRGKTN